MLKSKYNWHLQNLSLKNEFSQTFNVNPLILAILNQRGYKTKEQIKKFLYPNLNDLRSPFLIHDMKKGINRIKTAINNNEKITIYGDYDADGLTSTSIMYETLKDIGANADYYIPNRFTDGYGPNTNAFKKIIKNGTSLIITVDNGISGYDQIQKANDLNCDVIITDHHDFPDKIPNAYAIIHARFPGNEYPFGDFSGAGIAFKIASALLDEIPEELLDLASIGTIADLVSLTGENRIIVKNGLKIMSETQRPGLKALIKKAGFKSQKLNEENISFGIAPRLNALGRMGDANIGVKLLTTFDNNLAIELADFIETQNTKRKQLVNNITRLAMKQAKSQDNQKRKTLVIAGNNWHEGVVGIVASRIVETLNKPTIILNINQKQRTAKGSGRSVHGFDLFQALNPHQKDMISFGGHPMAIGLTISKDKIKNISNDLEIAGKKQKLSLDTHKVIQVTDKITIDDISMSFYRSLLLLSPFGNDNKQPIFEISPQSISKIKTMGKDNSHLSFVANGNKSSLRVIAFKKGNLANIISNMPNEISFIGCIGLNHWRGKDNLQILLKDIKGSGVTILDRRTRYLTKSMFNEHGIYVFFHSKLMKKLEPYQIKKSKFVMYNNLPDTKGFDSIIFVDCPDRLSDLYNVLNKIRPSQLILYFYKKNRIAKIGMPNRLQYVKLFKFLQKQAPINLINKIDWLSDNLKISKINVIFIIQLFIELKFVSVNDEILTLNLNPIKKSINNSKLYQFRQQQIRTEQQLLFKNANDLILFIKKLLINEKKEVLD